MIPPRRAGTAADPDVPEVIVGLLGAMAVLDELGDLIGELAADVDGPAPASSEVVDVLLGLAALGATAARRLPQAMPEPAQAAPVEPVALTLRSLLR